MNNAEISAILYYADYLSLKAISKPVTDNCKYFFIHDTPINASFVVNLHPFYDKSNQFYIKAYEEYNQLKNKFGDSGVMSFIENISELKCS